jgi:hypothetical protein
MIGIWRGWFFYEEVGGFERNVFWEIGNSLSQNFMWLQQIYKSTCIDDL